jgi:chemotaxis protein methyltransferase CheR
MPTRARAIDRAILLAERRTGVGRSSGAPGWLRDRVLTVLQAQAARAGVSLTEAADRLATDRGAIDELVTALRVGETRFYRDRGCWEAIVAQVLPALPPAIELRALSAGCSTGEEAYTLAMLLAASKRRFRVLGVDNSAEALEAARAGAYDAESVRDLPAAWAARFCEPTPEGVRVRPELARQVTFEQLDLVQRTPRGPFHLVLFKNVLLYLAAPAGEAVARRLASELDTSGMLFAASSEVPRLRQAGLTAVRIASGVTGFGRPGTPPPRW